MKKQKEEWKQWWWKDKVYQISNTGKVIDENNKDVKLVRTGDVIRIHGTNTIHDLWKLIPTLFLDHTPGRGATYTPKDGNIENIRLDNMERKSTDYKHNPKLCSGKDCILPIGIRIEQRADVRKPIVQCTKDYKYVATYVSQVVAAKETGQYQSEISLVLTGRKDSKGTVRKSARGYRWFYKNKLPNVFYKTNPEYKD